MASSRNAGVISGSETCGHVAADTMSELFSLTAAQEPRQDQWESQAEARYDPRSTSRDSSVGLWLGESWDEMNCMWGLKPPAGR